MRRLIRSPWLLLLLISLVSLAIGGGGYWRWLRTHAAHYVQATEADLARFRYDSAARNAHLAVQYTWPERGDILFLAARTVRRAGDIDKAREYLSAAERLLGATDEVRLEKQLLAVQRGDAGDLVESLMWNRITLDPARRVLILEALIQGTVASFRNWLTAKAVNAWLEQPTDDPRPYYWRGLCGEEIGGKFDQFAVADFQRALERDPEFDDARQKLASLLLKMRDLPAALPHYEELFRRRPDDAAGITGLARCLVELGEYDRGRSLFDRAVVLNPNSADAFREVGGLDLLEGRPEAAEANLRKACRLAPKDYLAAYQLAVCLNRLGRADEAKEFLMRSQVAAKHQKRIRELVRDEYPIRPRDPDLLFEIGNLFIESGEADQELTGLWWMQKALEVNPRHLKSRKVLADFYERKNMPEMAAKFRRLTQ